MSYAFAIRAASVAAAVAAIGPKFDEVVASQPVHVKDREVAIASAKAIAELVREPGEGEEVQVSVSGSIQWQTAIEAGQAPDELTGASVSVYASVIAKTE